MIRRVAPRWGMLALIVVAEARRPGHSLEFPFSSPSCFLLFWLCMSPGTPSRLSQGQFMEKRRISAVSASETQTVRPVCLRPHVVSLEGLFSLAVMLLLSFPLGLPAFQVGRKVSKTTATTCCPGTRSPPLGPLGITSSARRKATPDYKIGRRCDRQKYIRTIDFPHFYLHQPSEFTA
jgi:hypothetical protein